MTWLYDNFSSVAVGAVLLAAVIAALFFIIRDRRSGRGTCGGCCSACAMRGQCGSDAGDRRKDR